MTERGSPSMIFRPKFSTTRRPTTATSACTMCSIQTMVTPEFLIAWMSCTSSRAFGFGQAAGDFVEQQEPRRAGERPRQLKALPAEEVERAGAAVGQGDQPGALENFAAGVHHLRFALAAAVNGGDQEVLEHGEVFERVRNLKRAPDAGDAALRAAARR